MLIHHTVFYCELFSWFIFLAEWEILNFVDVGILMHTAWMTTCPPSVEQLDTASRVNFLFKSLIPSIFNCLSIVQKIVHKLVAP